MSSQRHKRDIHGYDSAGETEITAGDTQIPFKYFIEDQAGQSFDFKTSYFPTGTNFVLSSTPTGMSLNASTGALTGTPTTTQGTAAMVGATLTVTYMTPRGARTDVVPWGWAVGAASVAAGAFNDGVAATPVNFATSFPGAIGFGLTSIPAGMTFDNATGILSGTPTTVSTGTPTLFVKYPDSQTRSVSWSWAVT